MAKLPPLYFTHSQKVCALYKKALRSIYDYHFLNVPEWRYQSVLMRQRFEENRNIKDPRLAKRLLAEGEEEWFLNRHPEPIYFTTSPGGLAYERYYELGDGHLDYWEPWEKAQYPKYFALREKRKQDYIEFYKKEYLSAANEQPEQIQAGSHK